MATSVGSSAAFTSSNMKPASGEQIDALWGDNIADNTGFLRANKIQLYPWDRGTYAKNDSAGYAIAGQGPLVSEIASYQSVFIRSANHNRLVGTVRFDGTWTNVNAPDAYGTYGVYLYGDIANYGGTTTFGSVNIGGVLTKGTTFAFELDFASYLSVGSWGTVSFYFSGTSADYAGSNSVISAFGYPKLYTTWAN